MFVIMRIGFLIARDIFYKHFSSVIDEALKRGHQVFCLHNYAQSREGKKAYQFPFVEKIPQFRFGKVQALSFNSEVELLKNIKEQGIQALFSLYFTKEYIGLQKALKEQGVFWVVLQGAADILIHPELTIPDRFLVYTEKWLDLAVDYLLRVGLGDRQQAETHRRALQEKSRAVGFVEIDQKALINPAQVRAEWGIPAGKKVVLFLPFPFGSGSDRFWAPFVYGMDNWLAQLPLALLSFRGRYVKQVLRRWNDKQLVRALKEFCQNNNAFLLVKSRKKDPVRDYLKEAADKILYDEGFYPATIMKCLSIADICFNFYSATAAEAAAMGVPNICIAPSVKDWKDIQGAFWEMRLGPAKDFFDFEGVSWRVSIEEAIKFLRQGRIGGFQFNPKKQAQYMQRFVGDVDGGYSQRAVDELEDLLGGSNGLANKRQIE